MLTEFLIRLARKRNENDDIIMSDLRAHDNPNDSHLNFAAKAKIQNCYGNEAKDCE